jgi:hypothetical protein
LIEFLLIISKQRCNSSNIVYPFIGNFETIMLLRLKLITAFLVLRLWSMVMAQEEQLSYTGTLTTEHENERKDPDQAYHFLDDADLEHRRSLRWWGKGGGGKGGGGGMMGGMGGKGRGGKGR